MSDALEAWTELLDDVERRLDTVEAAIDAGTDAAIGTTVTSFAAPRDMAPLPTACADRARRLLARNESVIGAVADRLERHPRPSASATTRRPDVTTTSGGSRFEFRA